jgi:hypothetical protein
MRVPFLNPLSEIAPAQQRRQQQELILRNGRSTRLTGFWHWMGLRHDET